MESICEQLDETMLEFFDILGQLYNHQGRLGDLMKSGFLDLSRARYNMGTNSVTPSQFSKDEMKALVKLDIHCENGKTFLEVIHTENDKKNANPDEELKLRKRNVINDKEKGDSVNVETIGLDELPSDSNQSATDRKREKGIVNPINWFGVLVPQNLRRSQSSFKAAIDVSVTIANLKLKLQELKVKYRELLANKEELVKKEKEELLRKETEEPISQQKGVDS